MKLFYNIDDLSRWIRHGNQGSVISIGNFDGLHLGHQSLIKRLIENSKAKKLPSVLISFEPHPEQFYEPSRSQHRIFTPQLKSAALQEAGIDCYLEQRFNLNFAKISASDFIDHYLRPLAPQSLVVGYDFHFGHGRQGNVEKLQTFAAQIGCNFEQLAALKLEDQIVSSTRIRQLIRQAKVEEACSLLNRPYLLCQQITAGIQLGRKIGTPTLNLAKPNQILPAPGVYACRALLSKDPWEIPVLHAPEDSHSWAIAHIGTNPTVTPGRLEPGVEVHLLNQELCSDQQRSMHLGVYFLKFLREQIQFGSTQALSEQIQKDIQNCLSFFQGINKRH